jgi:hypothetical protein
MGMPELSASATMPGRAPEKAATVQVSDTENSTTESVMTPAFHNAAFIS